MEFINTINFAKELDNKDPLSGFREEFYLPQHDGQSVVYFTGNSLGLQPKSVTTYIKEELDSWEKLGVEGHFKATRPWFQYHEYFKDSLASIVGGQPQEVVSLNNLTSNLHFLFASFYRPTPSRYKIVMESGAFPSDQYMVETQVRHHGFDPTEAIIEVKANSQDYISLEDISNAIETHRNELALVFFSGVQYYSGQFFNIPEITRMAHDADAYAGFDLAHAAGNVPLNLHEDQVDFAAWCSYKYLNSGPGNVAGIFVHEKHATDPNIPRLGGWWGHDESVRFEMKKGFSPMPGADGWQVSNVNVLSSAAHLASLEIFDRAGIGALREKSGSLTSYLEFVIKEVGKDRISIITPSDRSERGCQISLLIKDGTGKKIFDYLALHGVIVDWREPNVIRAAPVPLYNTFLDIYTFGQYLKEAMKL